MLHHCYNPVMEEFLSALPLTFIPLFVAIDVFWLLGFFTPFTVELSPKQRKSLIRRAILTALLVGLGFLALGEIIFRVLGITINDFKVAGGALLFVISIKELTTSEKSLLLNTVSAGTVPLGVPLIVGPAVLTTFLVITEHVGVVPTIASFVLNLLIVWGALSYAHVIMGRVREEYITALSKIMALLLAAIAVMMIRLGIIGMIGSGL
jgi:multiple antibiotic resistance protein